MELIETRQRSREIKIKTKKGKIRRGNQVEGEIMEKQRAITLKIKIKRIKVKE